MMVAAAVDLKKVSLHSTGFTWSPNQELKENALIMMKKPTRHVAACSLATRCVSIITNRASWTYMSLLRARKESKLDLRPIDHMIFLPSIYGNSTFNYFHLVV